MEKHLGPALRTSQVLILAIAGLFAICVRGLDDLSDVRLAPAVDSGATLSTDADTLLENGQLITVTWSGVNDAKDSDVIALLALSPTGQANIPVRWRPVADAGGGSSGSGSLQFKVLNYRVPLQFVYLQPSGSGSANVIAESGVIAIRDPNEPLQGHLVLTGNPGEVMIMWTSRDVDVPRVYWGKQSGNWDGSMTAKSSTITWSGRCGDLGPSTLHWALLTGLDPSTTYHYKFGDVKFYFSKVYNFMSPPLASSSSAAKVLFFSDAGQATSDGSVEPGGRDPGSLDTARSLAADIASGFSLLVNGGDLVQSQSPFAWDTFFDEFSGSVLHAPLQPTASEMPDAPGCGGGIPLSQRFQLATSGGGAYSYTFGPLHFLHYDSTQDMSRGSSQYTFMTSDLAAVDRSKTPWLIVVGHKPVFPAAGASTMADVESLLQAQKVDLVLQGYNGWYERTSPTYKGVALPAGNAPVYVIAGNGGSASGSASVRSDSAAKLVTGQTGYLRLQADAGGLRCEFVASRSGSVLDSFSVVRNGGGGEVDVRSAPSAQAPGAAPGLPPNAAPAPAPGPALPPAPAATPDAAPASSPGSAPPAASAGGTPPSPGPPPPPSPPPPSPSSPPRQQAAAQLGLRGKIIFDKDGAGDDAFVDDTPMTTRTVKPVVVLPVGAQPDGPAAAPSAAPGSAPGTRAMVGVGSAGAVEGGELPSLAGQSTLSVSSAVVGPTEGTGPP